MEYSLFTRYWIIEIIRQREAHWGLCADSHAMRLARQQPTLQDQVYTRACTLAKTQNLLPPIQQFKLIRNVLLGLLALFAVLAGSGLANTVLTRNPQAISLLDALILLLAFNTVALLFWLVSFLYRGGGQGLGGILLQLGRACVKGPAMTAVAQAFVSLTQRAGLLRPGFSSISHGFWLCLLVSAFFVLWIRFLGQQYEFTWQTTLLSENAVQTIITYLNLLPGLFGIQAPSGTLLNGQPVELRQESATWLLACLALYGILPRLALLGLTECIRYQRKRQLTVDTTLPGLAELVPRFRHMPTAIVDPAPDAIPPRPVTLTGSPEGGLSVLVSLEHEIPPGQLELGPHVHNGGMIANSEQRQQLLGQLANGHTRQVLIVVDSRLSADRGSLRFIAELAELGTCAVWLDHCGQSPERAQYWYEQLANQFAIRVFQDKHQAINWLTGAHDE